MVASIRELLRYGNKELEHGGSPSGEAAVLLMHAAEIDRLTMAIHQEEVQSPEVCSRYLSFIAQRKAQKPVAYIVGKKEFMGLCFKISEDVLIPRPETETLVETVIKLASNSQVKILDLCTGSGCIAVSIAKHLPHCHVSGIDISEKALAVAQENAMKQDVMDRVRFEKCDLLQTAPKDMEQYDIVVSNPPYIETQVIKTLECDVKDFEPKIALDGGEDGLLFYRAIKRHIHHCNRNTFIALEIGYNQKAAVEALFAEVCYDIETKKDLSEKDRLVCMKKK